ncbi:uncharacterized protein LOC134148452 isoform X6 [Rhea pennata]|uniref:uncharacterized protein LOC134148452 isoform X6 n=1 Tax=Rhea pennata TaxID=8795 RepID=UPI002E26C23C
MKHGAGGPKHSEEVSANQLLLRALAGQSPGAITPASSESLRTQRRHQPRNWPILSWLTAAVMEAGERRRRRKRRRKRERENREQHLRKSEKLLQDLDTAEMFYPGGRGAMAKGAAVDRSRDVSRTKYSRERPGDPPGRTELGLSPSFLPGTYAAHGKAKLGCTSWFSPSRSDFFCAAFRVPAGLPSPPNQCLMLPREKGTLLMPE